MIMREYDLTNAKDYCENLGLVWNEQLAANAVQMAEDEGLDDGQLNRAIMYFCDIQRWQWSPRSWTWRQRIALALHFLFNPKGL